MMQTTTWQYIFGLNLLIILSTGCKNNNTAHPDETNIPLTNHSQLDAQTNWVEGYNESEAAIGKVYEPDIVSIYQNQSPIQGKDELLKKLSQKHDKIDSSFTITNIRATSDSLFEYEIIWHGTDKGEKFKSIVIWKNNNDLKKRQLEYIAPVSVNNSEDESINIQRQKWIRLCNQHNAQSLVEKLYTPNAIYYNHKPLVQGHHAITKDYSYMNDPNYKLDLTPIIIEPVNEWTVFEIGQCSGSYGGKYILVWLKQENGEWLVAFDSNI
jgi:ketosteroid isomerase-like protein